MTSTYFFNENMGRKGLTSCKYLFFLLKYELQYIPKAWPVADTVFAFLLIKIVTRRQLYHL